jgi:GT2 family glycosyltransferase
VKEALANAADRDTRIRVKYLDHQAGISENSNSALEMAKGDFVLFLDHDDLLAPNLLFEVIQVIRANPTVDFVYFDEDKVDDAGKTRRDPFFKPDWSPEMLLSANYLTHPVIRKALLDRVGMFNPEFDGTQDWELAFRCTEQTDRVAHIAKVLYHWRQVGGSTAGDFNAKPWVFERQLRAVNDHLTRMELDSTKAEFAVPGIIRTTWQLKPSRVSIVIPTKDHLSELKRCLSSIMDQTSGVDYEIILVDNASTEAETLAYYDHIKADPRVRTISYPETFNYSKANNLGASQATGDLLLFMNNDVEALAPDWLEEMVRWAQLPQIGVVGAKLLYPDGTIQHAGVVLGMGGHADHVFCHAPENSGGIFGSTEWYRDYSAVTAACMMLRKELFDQVGCFDEAYHLVYSDIELCLRVSQAGYRNMVTPFARLLHHEGKTRTRSFPVEDMVLGFQHLKDHVVSGDPYYNPNLSYAVQVPTLKPENEESRLDRLQRMVERSQQPSV